MTVAKFLSKQMHKQYLTRIKLIQFYSIGQTFLRKPSTFPQLFTHKIVFFKENVLH